MNEWRQPKEMKEKKEKKSPGKKEMRNEHDWMSEKMNKESDFGLQNVRCHIYIYIYVVSSSVISTVPRWAIALNTRFVYTHFPLAQYSLVYFSIYYYIVINDFYWWAFISNRTKAPFVRLFVLWNNACTQWNEWHGMHFSQMTILQIIDSYNEMPLW